MKLEQKQIVRENGVFVWVERIREHWHEWFVVFVNEGYCRPTWYLPVCRRVDRNGYECWVFPLAPFVLVGYIVKNCFWSVWKDLIEFALLTSEKAKSESQELREWKEKHSLEFKEKDL